MSKKAFDKIAEGLNEALAIAQGAAEPAKLHVPAEMDVRAIRLKAEMSQDHAPIAEPDALRTPTQRQTRGATGRWV